MNEGLICLVREVERVVTAPYIPSLHDLFELVQHNSSIPIELWALHKPCQVGLLVEVLIEALSRSRVALPLLAAFASTTSVRDALLEHYPTILDTFLEKILDGGESEYHSACIALIASPLPAGFMPPFRLAQFITRLVSAMASVPCSETIAPLHSLMTGLQGSPNFLKEVPTEVMSNLQFELTNTLRNLDDHMGNLLGLATFARIASIYNQQPRNNKSESPSWLLSIRHFFGAKRGLKTLDLVVLRVILACSSNSNNLTISKAAESIRLAILIADAIDPDQKAAWILNSTSKIAKLSEKVSREGLSREIQLMGIVFLISIHSLTSLPLKIRDLGLRLLISKDSRAILSTMPQYLVLRFTRSLIDCDESIVYELLRFTVDTLREEAIHKDSLSDLYVAKVLISEIQSKQSRAINSSLLNSDATKQTLASLLGKFPSVPIYPQCQGSQLCYCAYSALQNQVLLELFEIHFTATLSQNGDTTDITIMKSFVERAANSITNRSCQSTNLRSRDVCTLKMASYDRSEFSTGFQPSQDWRSSIRETFIQNAEASHQNMIKKVEGICFDLERRCYDVEGPVRAAEEERDQYKLEATQLRSQNQGLQAQQEQLKIAIRALKEDLARLEDHAESASFRSEELAASLASARQELQDQRQRSDETFQMEQDRARSRELDLAATCTAKDDQIEEMQENFRRILTENEQAQRTLHTMCGEKSALLKATTALEQELMATKSTLSESQILCCEKEDEVKRLLTENKDMQMEIGAMKGTTGDQKLEVERLHVALQEAEETAKFKIEKLRSEQEAETSQTASQLVKQKEENLRLQKLMQVAASDALKELQTKEKRIKYLERKLQSLRDERSLKAREFSEAQQHIGRLMNVMGFSANLSEKSSNQPQKGQSNDVHTTSDRRQSAGYDDEESELVQSFESLTSNLQAPTPKRPKGDQKGAAVSQAAAPKTPTPIFADMDSQDFRPQVSRQPLDETIANTSAKFHSSDLRTNLPKTGPSESPEKHHLQSLDLDMDIEFSKDFILTSTAFSGSKDLL
ncbi:hypothetical protein N7462_001789 [Penicillium macrosclerotiorum]|uniref:uncharacterized protein n=1 Tax=Penicillium macrosclerotiorum TaxID=303699 RepID=UPI0025472CD9|nr:uncharacterized protein N7462_001789 [Penicillium macrosclerotiorum]KAJ5692366.1 hypothetical protein N7462_001789 [Penicillium macrosclerotiorum]